jgi:hypothetical protein
MRIAAVAGSKRGRPGWTVLASMVMLTAVAAGLAAGGRPVQAAVRYRPGALIPDTVSSAGDLQSVSAVSPTDVWAAGSYYSMSKMAGEPLVLHWDGKTWATVKTPVFPAGVQTSLVSLSALSPTDAWVAGSFGSYASQSLILHCTATACQQVRSPSPGADLTGVSAVSPVDAWAAGSHYSVTKGEDVRLMLHWDGQAWKQVGTPAPRGARETFLNGLSAVTPTDVWAAGSYYSMSKKADEPLVLRWNGHAWTRMEIPAIDGTPFIAVAVSAVTPTDVWAAGYYGTLSEDPAIVHWNGKAWTQMKLLATGCAQECLFGVSALPATGAWTSGYYWDSSRRVFELVILHCNGTTCQQAKDPVPGQALMTSGVSADSPTDAWAVGEYGSTLSKVLILHWDGKTWTQVSPTGS